MKIKYRADFLVKKDIKILLIYITIIEKILIKIIHFY